MNKKEIQKRVLQNGKPLPLSKFKWDEQTKTFSSGEHYLVIDFNDWYGCTFNTGSGCTFNTGYGCTFNTGYGCTFNTWYGCTFNTGSGCTFNTRYGCTFNTGYGCTFNTRGVELKEPPIYFTGSRYSIGFSKRGWIKSGCFEKPLSWWKTNVKRCAEENGYTPEQVKEYVMYVKMIEMWMKRLKLDKE